MPGFRTVPSNLPLVLSDFPLRMWTFIGWERNLVQFFYMRIRRCLLSNIAFSKPFTPLLKIRYLWLLFISGSSNLLVYLSVLMPKPCWFSYYDFAMYFEIKSFALSDTVVVAAQDCLSYFGSFGSGFCMDCFLYFFKECHW